MIHEAPCKHIKVSLSVYPSLKQYSLTVNRYVPRPGALHLATLPADYLLDGCSQSLMSRRELQALLADPYLQAAVDLTDVPREQRQTRSQRASAMADNGGEPVVTADLLQRVQQLESCLRQAESVAEERAAKLELTRRELRRASDQAAEHQEEAERQQERVDRLHSELESIQVRMELEKLHAVGAREAADGVRVQASGHLD